MKRIISLIILVLAALVFTSCRVVEPTIITDHIRDTVTEVHHDTLAYTKPDSASINALLRCDSLGNVYVAEITRLKSGKATTQTFKLKDNKLSVDCKVDSMAVYLKIAKVYKTSERSKVSQPAPVIIDKPLSWWAKTINILGYIMLGVIVAGLIYAVVSLRGYLIGI